MPKLPIKILFPLLWLTVATIVMVAVTFLSRENLESDTRKRAKETLSLYLSSLEGEISKHKMMPRLMAQNPVFSRFLYRQSQDDDLLLEANKELERYNNMLETLDVFLLNANGLAVAASNWNQDYTYIGEELDFRPYFKEAMSNGSARYFALGTTSQKRGYYFSAAIYDINLGRSKASVPLGVIVIKVDLAQLEAVWASSTELLTVTDNDGIYFISTNPDWLYRSREMLTPERLQEIQDSRRFANIVPRPLHIETIQSDDGNSLVRLVDPESSTTATYMRHKVNMPDEGWQVKIWSDMSAIDSQLIRIQITTLLSLITLTLIGTLVAQRRRSQQAQQLLEQKSHDELQLAYGEMEHRVKERTAELSLANSRLQEEVLEKQQAELELREAQDNLVQAAKMAALGQMATSITHELNQPLGAVRTFADNARTYIDRGETQQARENLDIITRMTQRMNEIMRHLKTFARKTPLELVPTNLQYVIDETLLILGAQLQRHDITLEQIGDASHIMVLAEQVRLQQVMTNLLQNAIDVLSQEPVRKVTIEATENEHMVEISFRDSGPGFANGVTDTLFEPFVTTKNVGDGLGLGLSITYGIVKDFGGSIEAIEGKNRGAEFRLQLKLPDAAEDAVA